MSTPTLKRTHINNFSNFDKMIGNNDTLITYYTCLNGDFDKMIGDNDTLITYYTCLNGNDLSKFYPARLEDPTYVILNLWTEGCEVGNV